MAHEIQHLPGGLAQAHHDAALHAQGGGLGVPVPGRAGQHPQALGVVRVGAHPLVQALHGLHVVVQHVGGGLEHGGQAALVAPEIRDQHFHPAGGKERADPADGLGEMPGPAVGQIVPVHRGDHGEGQAQARHGFGHPLGLPGVHRPRAALAHVAEPAVAGAHVPQQHEGGGAVDPPALMEVGAPGLLADRDQALGPDEGLHLGHHLRSGNLDLQPRGTGTGEDGGARHRRSILAHV